MMSLLPGAFAFSLLLFILPVILIARQKVLCLEAQLIPVSQQNYCSSLEKFSATVCQIHTAFIPLFKEGKYYEGALNGLIALMNRLR